MAETWEQVKTKTQKKTLIKKAVKALESLVSSPQVGDLIKKILIAKTVEDPEYERSHTIELYITHNGLEEVISCSGHLESNYGDHEYNLCRENGKRKTITPKYFEKIVGKYRLLPSRISKISKQLRA